MKKTLIALAAFAAVAAQAEVRIYGSGDGAVRSQSAADSNSNALTYIDGGGIVQSNKLGFDGSEAIDGGLKASFRLESNLNFENGTVGGWSGQGSNASRFFDREAWVKLGDANNSIGFGKQYSPTFQIYCQVDAIKCLGANYFNSSSSVDQGVNVLGKRWDQTIAYDYTSAMFTADLTFANQQDTAGAFQGATPGSTVNRAFGGNLTIKPMESLMFAYGHQQETVASPVAATDTTKSGINDATNVTAAANNYSGYSGPGQAFKTTLGLVGASTYNVIKDVVGLTYTVDPQWKILINQNQARTSDATPEKLVNTGFGFQYTPSQKVEIAASYQRLKQSSAQSALQKIATGYTGAGLAVNNNADGKQLTMLSGYGKYFLSKTAYVYGEFDRTQWDAGYTGSVTQGAFALIPNVSAKSTATITNPTAINAYSIGFNKSF